MVSILNRWLRLGNESSHASRHWFPLWKGVSPIEICSLHGPQNKNILRLWQYSHSLFVSITNHNPHGPVLQGGLANYCALTSVVSYLSHISIHSVITRSVQKRTELLTLCWCSHLPWPKPPARKSSHRRAWSRSPVSLPEWPAFGNSRVAALARWTLSPQWWGKEPPRRRWLTQFSTSWQWSGCHTHHHHLGCSAPPVWPRTTDEVWSCGRQTSGQEGQVRPLWEWKWFMWINLFITRDFPWAC